MRKILTKIRRIPIFLSELPEIFFAAILVVMVLLCLYIFSESDFIQNQFPGLMLDIVVFGILIVVYNKIAEARRERRYDIKRWQEEIDDYRGWDEKGAMYRIVGNIRRLNKLRITSLDFHGRGFA